MSFCLLSFMSAIRVDVVLGFYCDYSNYSYNLSYIMVYG